MNETSSNTEASEQPNETNDTQSTLRFILTVIIAMLVIIGLLTLVAPLVLLPKTSAAPLVPLPKTSAAPRGLPRDWTLVCDAQGHYAARSPDGRTTVWLKGALADSAASNNAVKAAWIYLESSEELPDTEPPFKFSACE